MVCGFFLSWLGGPPQSFEHSIWDCVGFYMIHTFLDLSVESQFRIISKSYNFLFGTTTTQPYTFSTSLFFSGQSRHASSSSIMLYLWLGARRPTAVFSDTCLPDYKQRFSNKRLLGIKMTLVHVI
jgi:hypothetical protein